MGRIGRPRRRLTDEFKQQAVRLVLDEGKSVTTVILDASFGLNSRPAEIDYGYRGVHLAKVVGATVIAAYYGSGPVRSYYSSCSSGGRYGIQAAEHYPQEFRRHHRRVSSARLVRLGRRVQLEHAGDARNADPDGKVDARVLFIAPGMYHCGGGVGPNTFDALTALEQWVEQDQPPSSIVAAQTSGPGANRTRPLCPFPQHAVYIGTGSINDAANFECMGPPIGPRE